MAQVQTSTRRRRASLIDVPWSQRSVEDFRLSDVSAGFTLIGSGQHAGLWKVRIAIPGEKNPKVFGPKPYARIDELIAQRDEFKGKLRDNKPITKGRELKPVTLREWLPQFDTIQRQLQRRRGTTVDGYVTALARLKKYTSILDRPLVQLDRPDVEAWMTAALVAGVSVSSVNTTLNRLKTCVEAAIGRVPNMEINKIRPIKAISDDSPKKLDNYRTDPKNASRLMAQCYDWVRGEKVQSYKAAIPYVGTDCGLRRCELAGLQWGDVYLDGPQPKLILRRHITTDGKEDARQTLIVPGTKTSKGKEQTVLLSPRGVEALRQARDRLLFFRQGRGKGWKVGLKSRAVYKETGKPYIVGDDPLAADAFVFPNRHGDVWLPDSMNTWFVDTVCARAGIDNMSLHSLRHDCGSIMIGLGYPLTVVQHHMRHANAQITARHYAYLLEGQDATAPQAFVGLDDDDEEVAIAV